MMRKIGKTWAALVLTLCVGLLGLVPTPAAALNVTATVTADNHYVLYTGDATGNTLTRIGRNETTQGGNPGTYNWSEAESYNFTMDPCQYLYLAVWDDKSVDQMWSGEFSISGVGTLLSNTTDWVYYKTGITNPVTFNPYNSGEVNDAAVTAQIAGASWAAPLASASQGTAQNWGTIPGFVNPLFVWHNYFGKPNADDDSVILYRTESCVVPVPPTVWLLGSSLLGLVGVRRFRKN